MKHGDPHPAIHRDMRTRRDVAEMIGLAKGVLADGVITEDEAIALMNWADAHPDVTGAFPGDLIYGRLRKIFADGHASEEERRDLQGLLNQIVGGDGGMIGGETASTTLPLDQPPPLIEVTDQVFVFTGRFAYGTRAACEEAVRRIGGWPEKSLTKRANYLVIGTFASRDWIETPYGTKILKAQEYRDRFGAPLIVGEEHWVASVRG